MCVLIVQVFLYSSTTDTWIYVLLTLAVWQHETILPPCGYWTAKMLCSVWILCCAWFCPWLLQDRKKMSPFHPLLTVHNEGKSPPLPTMRCLRFMAAACDSSVWRKLLWAPVTRCCADITGWRRKSEALIICRWRLHLSHLLLRDVSLKLWPNHWMLRTFSPSSSEAESSRTEKRGTTPETWRISLQNRGGVIFSRVFSRVKHFSPPYCYY